MGIFRLGDCLTGRAIPHDEPIVALVIAKRRGGYPDAEKAAAHRPVSSTDIFEPVSLPIRARIGFSGEIEPLPGQLAVEIACRMTGTASWQEFERQAFDFTDGGGIAIQDDSVHRRLFAPDAPLERHIFGLTVFSEASWRHLQEAFGQAENRDRDLATMKAVLADAAAAMSGDDPMRRGRAIGVLAFKTSGHYTMADGSEVDLPTVGRALQHLEGGDTFSRDFSEWMDSRLGVVDVRNYAKGLPPYIEELAAAVWETQTAVNSLTWLNRMMMPSPAAGQRDNSVDVAGVSFVMLQESVRDMALQVEEGMVEDLSAMRNLAERLADLQTELQARMAALPNDDYSGPAV